MVVVGDMFLLLRGVFVGLASVVVVVVGWLVAVVAVWVGNHQLVVAVAASGPFVAVVVVAVWAVAVASV